MSEKVRNVISFWIFGLCNNFGYVMMLSAAQDILAKSYGGGSEQESDQQFSNSTCLEDSSVRHCTEVSTGVVLLANIIPSLVIKFLIPFFIHKIPYGVRHSIICSVTIFSFIVTALSANVYLALIGVAITSMTCGLGESTFLALASHFPAYSISAWSSGTGAAGVVGSFVYAALTDPLLLNLSPATTMFIAISVPVLFAVTFYFLLVPPATVRKAELFNPSTWIIRQNVAVADSKSESETKTEVSNKSMEKSASLTTSEPSYHTPAEKWQIVKGILIYMVSIMLVYYAEYFINQGLVELTVFDCASGFGTSPQSQYRWYQVLYQVGVFISRSSSDVIQLSLTVILLLPILQFANVFVFLANALRPFIPNFAIACGFVLFEGLIGGASYVNSFRHIHRSVDRSMREFALSVCSVADGIGILLAALTAIPVHNAICQAPYL